MIYIFLVVSLFFIILISNVNSIVSEVLSVAAIERNIL